MKLKYHFPTLQQKEKNSLFNSLPEILKGRGILPW